MHMPSINAALTAAIVVFALLVIDTTSAQEEESNSPYSLPFDIPEWLIPKDFGGKLPFLATDQLTAVGCPSTEVEITSYCKLPGDSEGVFVCRRFGPMKFSMCTPNVMTDDGTRTILGVEGDECGCCGDEPCPQECTCECNAGRGVLIETQILRWWHVKLCVPRAFAHYITPLRKEITCGVCEQ